ncbi:hypothetical protein SELMODRAFT_403508 [Selaginella moellendorffii]|uniref:Uncharacterized protein n=1 Tax=Selaginella moellendorffii TaxID=88036 RepID=D8QRM7_SELML|nr:hypothetical protein SELMODRAFT_403508 [Selaginella moellendorffii]
MAVHEMISAPGVEAHPVKPLHKRVDHHCLRLEHEIPMRGLALAEACQFPHRHPSGRRYPERLGYGLIWNSTPLHLICPSCKTEPLGLGAVDKDADYRRKSCNACSQLVNVNVSALPPSRELLRDGWSWTMVFHLSNS